MTTISGDLAGSLKPGTSDGAIRRPNTWQSVRNEVLTRIRSREWAPGQLIPTEQELAQELRCARATVNRALRELADSGVVERRRKVGTRVAATPTRRATLEIAMIRDEIEAIGASYDYVLRRCEVIAPPAHVARNLQLTSGDKVLVAKSKFLADGKPYCCEIIWMNLALLPPVAPQDLAKVPAHEWLASNVALTHGRFAILAEGASGDCADNLAVTPGTPVLAIERTNWSDKTPVSFARQFYPPGHRMVSED